MWGIDGEVTFMLIKLVSLLLFDKNNCLILINDTANVVNWYEIHPMNNICSTFVHNTLSDISYVCSFPIPQIWRPSL